MSLSIHKHNNADYPEYVYPSPEYVYSEQKKIQTLIALVCKRLGWDYNNMYVSKRLYEAIYRVDQRKLHYKMYRAGMILGEINEAALLCYWLLRYRPVRFKDSSHDNINEIIAIYILIHAVNEGQIMLQKVEKDFSSLVNDLLYAFMNRSMTYDSMTLLAQAMSI